MGFSEKFPVLGGSPINETGHKKEPGNKHARRNIAIFGALSLGASFIRSLFKGEGSLYDGVNNRVSEFEKFKDSFDSAKISAEVQKINSEKVNAEKQVNEFFDLIKLSSGKSTISYDELTTLISKQRNLAGTLTKVYEKLSFLQNIDDEKQYNVLNKKETAKTLTTLDDLITGLTTKDVEEALFKLTELYHSGEKTSNNNDSKSFVFEKETNIEKILSITQTQIENLEVFLRGQTLTVENLNKARLELLKNSVRISKLMDILEIINANNVPELTSLKLRVESYKNRQKQNEDRFNEILQQNHK
jgi:hypothetical protein